MSFHQLREELKTKSYRWLVTGAAGFIGSHLVEELLSLSQEVIGLDNLSTGRKENLEEIQAKLGEAAFSRFRFVEADVDSVSTNREVLQGVDFVLHQAALGSVPRSIEDPVESNRANVSGFVNLLTAAKDAGVKRFVFASSSSVYGDDPGLPKQEEKIGNALSPYALTKRVDELYAEVFARCYGLSSVGLRYFNVFGSRQDPSGPYAAVIPRWIDALVNGEECVIYGDGETSRDFCFVSNVVQANLLAALVDAPELQGSSAVVNVAVGEQTSLNQLFDLLKTILAAQGYQTSIEKPRYEQFRAGDVRHSLADIARAKELLAYQPQVNIEAGLEKTIAWHLSRAPVGR